VLFSSVPPVAAAPETVVAAGDAALGALDVLDELPHAVIIRTAAASPAGASHSLFITSPHSRRY